MRRLTFNLFKIYNGFINCITIPIVIFLFNDSGLMEWHFNTSSKMMNKIEFYQLRRPTTRFTANDLTELILQHDKNGGKSI